MTELQIKTYRSPGAVIYTRVSTGDQDKHGTSPETQRDACRKKAQALGLPIVAEYYDGGISGGFLLMRKEFQAAIADIQEGRADTLICPNISRYSRDVEHQQSVKKAVKSAGGRLVFCDMEFADTPEGDLNFDIQGSFAAYERKVIRARTMRGRRKRAEEGQQPARTTPPLGYHIVTKADVLRGVYPAEQLGRYIIVEPAASLARNIFEWYASGQRSLAEISKKFYADETPTVRGGKVWHPSTLSNILINPAYKGQAVFGRVEKHMEEGRIGQPHPVTGRPLKQPYQQKLAPAENQVVIACPALVSEELWDAVQGRLVSNRLVVSGNPRRVRMLAGRVHCPNCGGAMTYQPQKKSSKNPAISIPANYTCFQHIQAKRLQGETFCDAKTYRVNIIECAVTTAVLKAARSPASLAAAMQAHQASVCRVPENAKDPKQEMGDIYKALEQVDAQQAATVQAQIAGIMAGASPDAYAESFAAIAARRKDLEQRRGELKRQTSTDLPSKNPKRATQALPHADPETFLEKAYVVLTSPDVPEVKKRDMVGLLVESVTCHKDGARIEFLPGLFGMDGMVADREGNREDAETVQTIKTVSIGDLSSSIVHPREVFKDAVIASAASLIIAHNHPSGDPTPSAEDVAVTKRLIQAGEIMGIDLLDHIVLGDGIFASLKERGLI